MNENLENIIRRRQAVDRNLVQQIILRDVFNWQEALAEEEPDAQAEPAFDLNEWSAEDCLTHLRFHKQDIPRLAEALRIPALVRTRSYHTTTGTEGLCILLKRLSYPNRLKDLKVFFRRSLSALSEISNTVCLFIKDTFNHLLEDLAAHAWLNEEKFQQYANAVTAKGAAIPNCWAFIDGTARAICRPSEQQEAYYSGHKRFHCVKYQSVVTPDGLTVSLMGAFEGRRHDAGIFRESGFYAQLEEKVRFENRQYVLFGDQAYGIRELLLCPFPGQGLNEAQQHFNASMTPIRQAVEWSFSKVISEFAFVDFKKNQKLLLQEIEAFYKTATILTNCHTCLYGNQTSTYFNIAPIPLEQYLNINN